MRKPRLTVFLLMYCLSILSHAQPITIGTTAMNPPMASMSDNKGHFFGFEIDLMNEICNRLHLECTYKQITVKNVLTSLYNEDIDFAISTNVKANLILPGIIFSLPYMPSNGQFMTLKSSSINTPEELVNKTIGMREGAKGVGSLFQEKIATLYKNQLQFKTYPTINDVLIGLSNHEVDAIYASDISLKYWYDNNQELYKLIGKPIPTGEGYEIVSTFKYQGLMQQVNQAILNIMADGTYEKIYDQYFLTFK